jgi:metal-dependent HD superfamily phosphatase/phosphodiesterase
LTRAGSEIAKAYLVLAAGLDNSVLDKLFEDALMQSIRDAVMFQIVGDKLASIGLTIEDVVSRVGKRGRLAT